MFNVKLTTPFPDLPLLRQTPGGEGRWGEFRFFLNQEISECDYWVVLDGLSETEATKCPRENTVLVTLEPPSIKMYDEKFLNQFSGVITCHDGIKHPNVLLTQQAMPWHIGMSVKNGRCLSFNKGYDQLKTITAFKKDRLISVISSGKKYTEGHKKRVAFAEKLKNHFGSGIDVFGRDKKEIEDKWDGISRYRYHIALENSSCKDYWTEKLSDAFLGGAYPFYYGCPNIGDYFPEGSLTEIDIEDFDKSVLIIEEAIESKLYERSVGKICKARDLVLDKYNIFPMICEKLDKMGAHADKRIVRLEPERDFTESIVKKTMRKIMPGQ